MSEGIVYFCLFIMLFAAVASILFFVIGIISDLIFLYKKYREYKKGINKDDIYFF